LRFSGKNLKNLGFLKPILQPCTRRERRGTFLFPKSSTHLHSHQSSHRRHINCSLTLSVSWQVSPEND